MKDHLFVKSLYLPVLRILNKYAQVSGHIINLEKSTMTFSPGMLQSIRGDSKFNGDSGGAEVR